MSREALVFPLLSFVFTLCFLPHPLKSPPQEARVAAGVWHPLPDRPPCPGAKVGLVLSICPSAWGPGV